MTQKQIMTLLKETAYKRVSATEGEEKCAVYLKEKCEALGAQAVIETFPVAGDEVKSASLIADGKAIPCEGFQCCGSAKVKAPFYYMPGRDKASLAGCRGKIVMVDGGMPKFFYQDLVDAGAVGFITYNGNVRFPDRDIDQMELRSYVSLGRKLPGVNLHAKDAVKLVENQVKEAEITVEQTEKQAESRNVVAWLPGESDEFIAFSAHYDTRLLSLGAYDNMSGCIGLLGILEKAAQKKQRHYGMKFIFCGSEERGLLGSKAYTEVHAQELEQCLMNINLDMIGSTMGKFIACVSGPEAMKNYIEWRSCMEGFGLAARTGVYSSDSTPFADRGVPAVSFARLAGGQVATIHDRYDTVAVMSAAQMVKDIDFIASFSVDMACAAVCPVERVIPDNVKKELDEYLGRKRP